MNRRIPNSLRALVAEHLAALALRGDETPRPLPPLAIAAMLALHLIGLAAFWRYYHQPLWLALPTLALLVAFPVLAWRLRRAFVVETLAPLFFLYAILIARVIAVRVLLAREPYQDEASFADPRFIFFQVEATVAAGIAYTALAQTVRLTRGALRARALVLLAAMLVAAALAWFAAETIGHRARGVTATDPYAYAQMAVDLATRGTPLHTFSLFPYVVNLNVSWYPIEHIGYRLFDNLTGNVPTVWPIGGSLWLALAYRLLGEEGLYLATPLASLASLIAFALLAWEYFAEKTVVERAAIAAISVALLATSWEQVDRSIVPLVDAQAQLFSVLAILFALRAARRGWVFGGALSGLTLGAAYFVRHTQVLLAVPIALAALQMPTRERFRFLAATALAALVVALPDLWYHQHHFGGWFTPESHEFALFSFSNILPSAAALGERFFAGNEFGYLILFLTYGVYRAARDHAWKFSALAAWILLLTAFHLLYAAVQLRDLLPEFPALILLTAYGMIAFARDMREWAGAISWQRALVALAIFIALLSPAMRTRLTILRPFEPAKVTFGYVTRAQRASFDQVAALTPRNAVIGSTMNDGPIDLYAQRATFRPGVWNANERALFVDAMQQVGRPVYLLDDGTETSAARRDLSTHYVLRRIAVLDVPLFGDVDGTPGALWEIGQ